MWTVNYEPFQQNSQRKKAEEKEISGVIEKKSLPCYLFLYVYFSNIGKQNQNNTRKEMGMCVWIS